MEYVLLFIFNWIVFFILIDYKKLKINMLAGFLAIIMVILVDYPNIVLKNLYYLHNPVIKVLGSSFFFLFGPVFVISTLVAQNHPRNKNLIILHVFVIATLYSFCEYVLLKKGSLVYVDWSFYDSLKINYSAVIIISWFNMLVLDPLKNERSKS
ncbi:hypothetical protein PV797_17425 [Clostridiaceae bacterium M8S5]|nr:hypothetical protein PV797_17425 [Clostridiaceae bacterium M8S5]